MIVHRELSAIKKQYCLWFMVIREWLSSSSMSVCVFRPPIKLSGHVEETVPVGGSVRADCVCFLCIACVHWYYRLIIVQFKKKKNTTTKNPQYHICIFWQFTWNVMFHLKTLISMSIPVVFISLSLVCCSTGIVGRLAAHVGVFDLHSEQSPVCTHAKFIPLQPLIEVQVSP